MSKNIILIQKYLAKSISPGEMTQLEAWLSEHPDNRQILDDYKQIWALTADYQPPTEVDTTAALSRFRHRTAKEKIPVAKQARVRPIYWMASAAAVLLLVFAAYTMDFIPSASPQMIQVSTLDEAKSIQLPDGSVVALNDHSSLSYPESFEREKRQVVLEGEGFFEVKKDSRLPFVIKSNGSEVTVLGTSFNVRSYKEEGTTEVAVTSGKVRFAGRSADKTLKFVLLEANEKGTYLREEKNIVKQQDPTLNSSSWKTQHLTFKDSPVSEVLAAVGKHYKIQFDTRLSKSLRCEFTTSFKNNSLEDVLESLRLALGVRIEKTGKTAYKVSGGKSC